MQMPEHAPASPKAPRENAPLDDALPGAGDVVPVGAPPEDEALGAEAPTEARPKSQGDAPRAPTARPSGPAGDPLPGAGEVVPVRQPPEDEALGEPLDEVEPPSR
jgi:hypothetical protein